MVEIIKNILSKSTDQIAIKSQLVNFASDIDGKRLLNKEISKLHDKSIVLSEPQLNDIVITCNVIIDKMAKLDKCGWDISELKSNLLSGIVSFHKRKDNEDLEISSPGKSKLLNATAIGKHFNVSSQRLNLILAELGWIKKDISGWAVTKLGKSLGGRQYEHDTSGGNYVLWSDNIIQNKNLTVVFKEIPSITDQQKIQQAEKEISVGKSSGDNFRDRFPATLRTKDGHMVRSRAEVIIDNALYDYKLAHAYERKLPIDEDVYTDFFIPTENVYIEFWGMEDDPIYAERKERKKAIYKKYDFKLIELHDHDISNLDDNLPKKLLKFNIKVY